MRLTIDGKVLIGDDGELYLAYGAHRPLAYVLGKLPFPEDSIRQFDANLRSRRVFCEKLGLPYAHIVAPDKHSVVRDAFPLKAFRSIGDKAAELVKAPFLYPAARFAALHEAGTRTYHRTDTHWNHLGAILATLDVARALGIADDEITAAEADLMACLVPKGEPVPGDLGLKLTPVRSDDDVLVPTPGWDIRSFFNGVEGNDGKMALHVSNHGGAKRRLLIFGDSFITIAMMALSAFFSEILICRTPTFHREMVALYQPTHVLTENVERYLVSVPSDREARPFMMMSGPGPSAAYDKADYEALSAVLSSKRDDFAASLWR